MADEARGILITGTGAVVLSLEGVVVQLVRADQWTILTCRGPLMAAGCSAPSPRSGRPCRSPGPW